MLELNSLDEIRGNNVVIYAIKTLLERKAFPHLSIMSGVMGVGKTSVAKIVASLLDESGAPTKVYNFGMSIDLKTLQEEVFSLNPIRPRVFIFEEIQGMGKTDQEALLQMFDNQGQNIYIICTTTEIYKVIKTIKSRAQVWEFRSLSQKQMAHLLDDYLESKKFPLSANAKYSLLRASKGVPRDLLKNADLAIAGCFSDQSLDELLGNVSDTTAYALFCALCGETADFVLFTEELFATESSTVLSNLKDFWLRYLMERAGATKATLSTELIKSLDSYYTAQERLRVSQLLLRAKADTLLMELIAYNMSRLFVSETAILGQQRNRSAQNEIEERSNQTNRRSSESTSNRVTGTTLREFQL